MISIEELYQLFKKNPAITTDSRKATAGEIFFALKGERFDGNQYAEKAVEQGASYAVIDNPSFVKDERYLLVDDVLASLQDLATHHRRQFSIPVIAITGSNGKTTTKELTSVILKSHYLTHFTKGNFNNHIGVPLTLLQMKEGTKVAIIEMGANHVGEIADLCRIAEPTHGLITNIGKAHLEGFGGIEGVKKGKSELYQYLAKSEGVAFVNESVEFLADLSMPVARKIFYKKSEQPSPDVAPCEMKLVNVLPTLEVAFLSRKSGDLLSVVTQLIGEYNFNNIMTAVAVGRYFKVPDDKMIHALGNYQSSNNRSQVLEKGSNTFILDAYNANPTSMGNALESFDRRKDNNKIAILGDMLELGEYSLDEHTAIVEKSTRLFNGNVVFVGQEFAKAVGDRPFETFPGVEELRAWYYAQHFEHTTFLLKGSRGISLEKLLD